MTPSTPDCQPSRKVIIPSLDDRRTSSTRAKLRLCSTKFFQPQ